MKDQKEKLKNTIPFIIISKRIQNFLAAQYFKRTLLLNLYSEGKKYR